MQILRSHSIHLKKKTNIVAHSQIYVLLATTIEILNLGFYQISQYRKSFSETDQQKSLH